MGETVFAEAVAVEDSPVPSCDGLKCSLGTAVCNICCIGQGYTSGTCVKQGFYYICQCKI